MGRKPQKIIAVRAVGKPDIELAVALFAPLFQKIHERNQTMRHAPTQQQENGADDCTGRRRE